LDVARGTNPKMVQGEQNKAFLRGFSLSIELTQLNFFLKP
jgi:hypothetical protein